MVASVPNPENTAAIDRSLQEWRQGDVVLGPQEFMHAADLSMPITPSAAHFKDEASDEHWAPIMSNTPGLVILTQTCDVVRSCETHPYLEVAPLLMVPQFELDSIRVGRRPGFAYLPELAPQGLIVDLNRVMTIEKACLRNWQRTPGWASDDEIRTFARALARKRSRFAFPNDFVALSKHAQDRMKSKHGKQSEEGEILRALREIRVAASPSWDADRVALFFWFIQDEMVEQRPGDLWEKWLQTWLSWFSVGGRFTQIEGTVTSLEDMTGRDYVYSDPFDLDHLSA